MFQTFKLTQIQLFAHTQLLFNTLRYSLCNGNLVENSYRHFVEQLQIYRGCANWYGIGIEFSGVAYFHIGWRGSRGTNILVLVGMDFENMAKILSKKTIYGWHHYQ